MDKAKFGIISEHLSFVVTGKVFSTGIGQVTQSVYPFILLYQFKSVFLANTVVVACAISQLLVDLEIYGAHPKKEGIVGDNTMCLACWCPQI